VRPAFAFSSQQLLTCTSSLVKKDFSPDFLAFMKKQGIEHVVIDMQGTKKVDIPEAVMHSIMKVALNKANHPLLIHCNHGKVCDIAATLVTTSDSSTAPYWLRRRCHSSRCWMES
jgi:hypothetical protein